MKPVQTLDSYLDFVTEDEILIRGTRIGLEQVIRAYNDGASPEEIALNYPALSLEKIYGVITYYLANKEFVQSYLNRIDAHASQKTTDDLVQALRHRLNERHQVGYYFDPDGAPLVRIEPTEDHSRD